VAPFFDKFYEEVVRI
jgi:hypothetical protein